MSPKTSADFSQMCPKFEQTFELLGRRWTGLVLRALMDGPRRFSEITAYVPNLSDRLLSERLKDLEEADIVERRVDPSRRPVLVEYALTKKGLALRPTLESLQSWADRWVKPQPTTAHL